VAEETEWLGTKDASARLGITLRSLYRFIDEGDLPAYKFGRVIRMKVEDIDSFIESCRIRPGQLEHLYPPLKGDAEEADGPDDPDDQESETDE
jgi:excisionase family DNA binding protein